MRARRALSLSVLLGSLALMAPGVSAAAVPRPDLVSRLMAVPGLKVVAEQPAGRPGYRFFRLTFRQPLDHRHPKAGSFEQRVTLMGTGLGRPAVLYTTGFTLPQTPFLAEPAQLLGGNQISVEERFFGTSLPKPVKNADWSKLDIWQAASDHHDLVQALKPVFRGRWISTGMPGKGGMTTVYHRRFYPRDVDGSIVYSAADDVHNAQNQAYDRFFARVGPTACRMAIEAIQREALIRRAQFIPRYAAAAKQLGYTFNDMGSLDRAWEGHVRDTAWGFWQNHGVADCGKVPLASASTDVIWKFFTQLTVLSWYADQFLDAYMPFYYQALTQLGWPQPSVSYLADLRKYPGDFTPRAFVPVALQTRPFDTGAMADIDHWVRTAGSRLVFLYGGNDPYSAKPFRLGSGTRDSLWYSIPGIGTSDCTIQALPKAQRLRVISTLRRWAKA